MPLGTKKNAHEAGFTLLELLIVISILVILSTVLLLVLNPVETIKKSRDTQRISDLTTIKSALGFYLTSTTTQYLAGAASNDGCKAGSSYASGDNIYYSYPSDSPGAAIIDSALDGGSGNTPAAVQPSSANLKKVDANGWLPVNLASLVGGSPISNLPTDPVNTVTALNSVSASDFVYRYACDSNDSTFEVNANLESNTYTTSPTNYEMDDGGNNNNLYEVGTKLTILGTGIDF